MRVCQYSDTSSFFVTCCKDIMAKPLLGKAEALFCQEALITFIGVRKITQCCKRYFNINKMASFQYPKFRITPK